MARFYIAPKPSSSRRFHRSSLIHAIRPKPVVLIMPVILQCIQLRPTGRLCF